MAGSRGSRYGWRALASGLVLVAVAEVEPALAQQPVPVPPTGPIPYACECQPVHGGRLRRAYDHTCFVIRDKLVGYPSQFAVPPVGFRVNEQFAAMKVRADVHDFILYQSDFLAQTATLTPDGAQRLTQMANRLSCWIGPVMIEWTPEKPALAETRREAVLALLRGAGMPIDETRVAVAPSPYTGMVGIEPSNNNIILYQRNVEAPTNYSTSPTSTATFGGGPR